MKITINGKGTKVTDVMQKRIEDKLGKFRRYFGDTAQAHVKLWEEKECRFVEITLKLRKHNVRAVGKADDFASALDRAVEVLEGQFRKNKARLEKRIRDYTQLRDFMRNEVPAAEPAAEQAEGAIIRRKSFVLEPMDAEEAVLEMELLGHNFLLFRDVETAKVCAVYKRNDGNYGLIEPQD